MGLNDGFNYENGDNEAFRGFPKSVNSHTNELFAGQPQPAAPSTPLIAIDDLLDLYPILRMQK